ncbi:MAG: energy transducer TonB [Acidobacteria bacterium]|nr:energy transducer TonB [Acidobacteriota bacterium]
MNTHNESSVMTVQSMYLPGLNVDNTLLKKSFLVSCLLFLVSLWVVIPSSASEYLITDDSFDDVRIVEIKPPETKKPPETRIIRVKPPAAVFPDETPYDLEVSQDYEWTDEEQYDPTMEGEWVYVPGTRMARVGIDVKKPDCYYQPQPAYPELARQIRKEGFVVLDVIWDTNGNIRDARVTSSPGAQFGFDDVTVATVKQWKCVPATVGGQKVEVKGSITVIFKLN